jgi:hypothetical protein
VKSRATRCESHHTESGWARSFRKKIGKKIKRQRLIALIACTKLFSPFLLNLNPVRESASTRVPYKFASLRAMAEEVKIDAADPIAVGTEFIENRLKTSFKHIAEAKFKKSFSSEENL